LTLKGWTSSRLAEAFGVREDTVRLWRSQFMNGGIEALETRSLPGPEPAKTGCARPADEAGPDP
jgi:transposase-like protein